MLSMSEHHQVPEYHHSQPRQVSAGDGRSHDTSVIMISSLLHNIEVKQFKARLSFPSKALCVCVCAWGFTSLFVM